MIIETVNELIQSLESAGELSIKERKYLELAKAYQQLAAENVALVFSSAAHKLPDDVYFLYRHAQQPIVDADDNFYSWFGREWHENYQHNQYTTAAKQMLGVMAESAWKAGRRAAMLQEKTVCTCPSGDGSLRWPCPVHAGNSPVIPDSARDALEKALAAMEFMGDTLNNLDAVCTEDVELVAPAFDAVRSVLAAAPQEVR
ncbi:TPA: hypothetical protein NEF85_004270 [Klebsiella oxytoca]|nr:hypothetical protein [Klebsiella oxytoca]